MLTLHMLMRTVILFISARPRVLSLPPGCLEKTTLGRLTRPKFQNALAEEKYKDQEIFNDRVLQAYRESHFSEHKLVAVVKETLGLDKEIGIDMPILDTGITLVDFGIEDIPMTTIMINTTVRSLAAAVQKVKASYLTSVYQTVVTL
ncbi:Thioesterase [Penicillium sp. CMV-2018d]|nr:Thioesterase [Penicillium sp. CMV-2018d]